MSEVRTPFEAFRDTDGTPLDGGYIYIGIENQEPITHPASVFWDADLTIAAAQPIRTLGGYPVRAGAPAKVYASGGYSICVKNKNGEIIVSAVSSGSLEALLADATSASRGAGMVGYGSGVAYPAGTIGDALASIPSAYVTSAADQAQTYRAFTAAGTAPAFTLTPSPAVTALAEPMGFEVKFAANGTAGSNTLNVSGLGAVALKQYDSTGALVDGVVKSGQIAKVHYNGTYWVILNPLPSSGGGSEYVDFNASCTGASAVITMTAARVTLRNASGSSVELSNVSETLTVSGAGAGGLDTGSLADSTWYHFYFIYNPATGDVSSLASLSATAPTLPSGYTFYRRMGAFRTDATANKYPLAMTWRDAYAEYTESSAYILPGLTTGATGSVADPPTFTSTSIASYVPPTACRVKIRLGSSSSTNGLVKVAPSTSCYYPAQSHNSNGTSGEYSLVEFNYISSAIGVASQANASTAVFGWVDNGGPIYVEA